MIRLRYGKTPYELLHNKPPDLSFLHVFGALCYPINDSENLGKLQPKADIGIFIGYAPTKKAFRIYNRRTKRIIETIHVDFDELTAMASEHSSSEPALHEMTPATISSGLVPNPPPSTPFVPPLRTDWDILFQPMFDESLNPPPSVDLPAPEFITLNAPSTSDSQTTPKTQSPVIPNDVEKDNHDLDVAHMNNNLFFGIPIPENDSESSSSSDVIPTIVHTAAPYSEHVNKWTKYHPFENIIGELERPVSTRLQLHEQALFCYYDAFLTSVKPKNYKDALTQACWIKVIQEELNEFEHLEVWELVPYPDKVMVITLKWIYKVKLDELGGILKNKTAFLNGILREEVYVNQPDGFVDQDNPNHVYRLKKSLYGNSLKEPWIPDCSSKEKAKIFSWYKSMLMNYGMESSDPVDTPMVEKSKLDEDKEGKAVDPSHYHGMIGTLFYLTASRPDLQFAICMCTWYQARPTKKHLHAVKRIFWYLKGTVNRGLWYSKDSLIALTAFVNADHASCQDTRRSTSGSMQFLGDRLVSWLKHIDIRCHFIKKHVENGVIELYFVNTEYQLADIFTKALGRERIEFLINKLGMRSFTPETLKQLADEVDE
ncbi:retrovirus-related pol polyprotein from transposon TNT 1-94 [Tanacetum coccineum]